MTKDPEGDKALEDRLGILRHHLTINHARQAYIEEENRNTLAEIALIRREQLARQRQEMEFYDEGNSYRPRNQESPERPSGMLGTPTADHPSLSGEEY